jgi:hypothetical protein
MTLSILETFSHKTLLLPRFSTVVAIAGKLVCEVANRQRTNSTIRGLSANDLRDVGLIESDLLSVRNLELSTSASEILRDARRSRLGNW